MGDLDLLRKKMILDTMDLKDPLQFKQELSHSNISLTVVLMVDSMLHTQGKF